MRIDGDPTPEEIRKMCRDIRATWPESKRRRLYVNDLPDVTVDDAPIELSRVLDKK